jgi:transposase
VLLTAEQQTEVLIQFFTEKKSIRSIALELGLDRKTIKRVIERRSVVMARRTPGRCSQLDDYKVQIESLMQKEPKITATAILHNIRSRGYSGGFTILRLYVRKVRQTLARPREAFLRLEFEPGDVAQVDWGEFGEVFGDGVKVHCFAMVLAYSRMVYIEFTRSEKFEEFVRCHEHAFEYFGGAPKSCWYDNLATAVTDRMGSLVRFNSRFMAYMGHHSIRPHACNVARGNEKGRVEDLIKYIRMNFWSGREFKDFDDLQLQAILWRNQTANQREHRSTRRVVRIMFESLEKEKLLGLNPVPYDTDEIFSRYVTQDFHFQYETNRYSVPWTLVGMTVTIRVNAREIKIYYHEKFVSSHKRSYLKNQVITTETHRAGLLERKPGVRREDWQLTFISKMGPPMADYIELINRGPRSIKNEIKRLIGLTTIYGEAHVLAACSECLRLGVVGVDNVELTLKGNHHSAQQNPAPIHFMNEKLNRVHSSVDLRRYDALYFEGDNQLGASEEIVNGNSYNITDSDSHGGAKGFEAESLGQSDLRGLAKDEGPGNRAHNQIPDSVDLAREIRTQVTDDRKSSADSEVPSAPDGREF